NRDHQKALVSKHIKELARSDSRRLMALVAYGATGNRLDDLWEQLRLYLELDASDVVDINWRHLHFPEQREKLGRDLEDELKLQLEIENNEPVKHLLRRHGPRVIGTGKRGVLWLNWGVFGKGGDRQAPLYSRDLGEWLRFSSEFLGTHCPADLRIVSFVAIETEESGHKKLGKILKEYRGRPWCRSPVFRLSSLPPLGKISEDDLYDFLDDPAYSNCDPGIHAEVVGLLVEETGGNFEQITALIDEANKGSWYSLLEKLGGKPDFNKIEDDEPL
ncbi:MAG: hypothetical protein GY868_18135, partial [Deltaproteobacteria bacterium]|nr:hypothetical protein [Deltaproteobacteria bacterium]